MNQLTCKCRLFGMRLGVVLVCIALPVRLSLESGHTLFFTMVNILFSNSVYETIVRKYSAGLIWNRESGTREGSVSISVNIAMYVEYRH